MARERRKNRSEVPTEAASLFLESMASRSNLRAVALAAEDGFLVCGAAAGGFDCDTLAAIGAAQRSPSGVRRDLVERFASPERLHTSRLDIGGETFYLASIGERRPRTERAAVALRRILGSSVRAPAMD